MRNIMFPIPPECAAFWRQAASQGLTRQIKIVPPAKTGRFPSDIKALKASSDAKSREKIRAAIALLTVPVATRLSAYAG
ncbi:MAG: hypothetical protein ACOH2M_13315 [Cypionkella sp.]